jgi:squalene-hopene/tetraprenyl-beta-curcumene cyclase
MLLGLVISKALPLGSALLKLDAFLPELKADDRASGQATVALCAALGLDPAVLLPSWSIVANGRLREETEHVQQFLSLDVLPGGQHKVNVYFRPFGLQAPYVSVANRPRVKPTNVMRLDQAVITTIALLEGQRALGFPEASHRMLFPRAAGFGGESDEHVGSVFQRALIAEALLTTNIAGFHINWDGIDEDVRQLVALKCQDVAGGWRYFPGLPELPPDADDLAVILRLLVRARHSAIADLCDDPLRLLFTQHRRPSGGFGTWIVDLEDSSETTGIMRRAIEILWGDGVDVEVVANLLHALVVYDPTRFRGEIAEGVRYVVAEQQPTGAWHSSWYHGDFYGTFVCTRFLAATVPNHYALLPVAQMLGATQANDGGWGQPASTPTDTALALLTAALPSHATAELGSLRDRAVAYLLARQAQDGHWPAHDFIQMDTNRVRTMAGDGQPRIMSYKSETVTSALCVQALCAARTAAAGGR